MTFDIQLTEAAESDLSEISDHRTQEAIVRGLAKLADEPEKRGKPLTGELAGFYSVRLAGQRYRAVYDVYQAQLAVRVIAIGIRRDKDRHDAYAVAKAREGR